MKYFLKNIFLYLIVIVPAYADRSFTDLKNLGRVELRSEVIPNSSRVYLLAEFLSIKPTNSIFCELSLEIKHSGHKFKLIQTSTLLPNEKIPYTVGVFPNSLHASSAGVSGELNCRELPIVPKKKIKILTKKLEGDCCMLNIFKVICSNNPAEGPILDIDSAKMTPNIVEAYPPCFPESNN